MKIKLTLEVEGTNGTATIAAEGELEDGSQVVYEAGRLAEKIAEEDKKK